MTIEKMRKSMIDAGVYSIEDIEEICKLEADFLEECEEIALECEKEGYPANGSNYDLRCGETRKYYDEKIQLIVDKYEEKE